MSTPMIDVERLRYAYPDGTLALNGVSFSAERDEAVGLVGANGAGKSTLLLHLNGCLMPQDGTVSVAGVKVARKTVREVRRKVGMLFQDPDDQLFMPTVEQDVAFGPLNLGLTQDEASAAAAGALERVGALALAARPPYRLSGGEKRVAAIASVLAMDPDVMVMDEPSSDLDPGARRRLIRLLRSLDHTKIVATHDLDLALELCDRVVVLKAGAVAADGPASRILSDETLLRSCGLELPLTLQK